MPLLIVLALLAVEACGIWLVGELIDSVGLAIWLALLTSFIGMNVLSRARERMSVPAMGMRQDALLMPFVGGVLLVVPGFLTDLLGVLCLLKPTRPLMARLLQRFVARAMKRMLARGGAASGWDLEELMRRQGTGSTGSDQARRNGERIRDADFEVIE